MTVSAFEEAKLPLSKMSSETKPDTGSQHGNMETDISKKRRKEEGKRRKRQRIEESGGVRPRTMNQKIENRKEGRKTPEINSIQNDNDNKNQDDAIHASTTSVEPTDTTSNSGNYTPAHFNKSHHKNNKRLSYHRFGRVMDKVPCRNKPRFSTVSIALPGSVLSNCQTKELRTLLVGQIARAATIYHVDEIVVFDDKLANSKHGNDTNGAWRDFRRRRHHSFGENEETKNESKGSVSEEKKDGEISEKLHTRSNSQEFMARLLQYCECPQYLRRNFFPMHPDLQFAGLLAPVDAPHHVRAEDHSKYREGVVLNKTGPNGHSIVNCGIRNRPVEIDRVLAAGIRCTVQIDPTAYPRTGSIQGMVVSPATPREDNGTYWGYTTRLASSINEVFEQCPYGSGYDLKIGTSERGNKSVEEKSFGLPKFEHSLIVFGGVAGIEECVDAEENIKMTGSQSKNLFDMWLNTCPFQGSRTVRTEEAVLISLAKLSPFLSKSSRSQILNIAGIDIPRVQFSDESPSDESSEESESSSDDSEKE